LKMRAEKVRSLADARVDLARGLVIEVKSERLSQAFPQQLATLLEPYREGRCAVKLNYRRPDAEGRLLLGATWRVRPQDELLENLRDVCGQDNVSLEY